MKTKVIDVCLQSFVFVFLQQKHNIIIIHNGLNFISHTAEAVSSSPALNHRLNHDQILSRCLLVKILQQFNIKMWVNINVSCRRAERGEVRRWALTCLEQQQQQQQLECSRANGIIYTAEDIRESSSPTEGRTAVSTVTCGCSWPQRILKPPLKCWSVQWVLTHWGYVTWRNAVLTGQWWS